MLRCYLDGSRIDDANRENPRNEKGRDLRDAFALFPEGSIRRFRTKRHRRSSREDM